MRIFLKILAIPFMLLLTIFVAFMKFLAFISGWVFVIMSFICGIGALIALFSGNTIGGIGGLVIAFLISPYGLPMLAVHLTAGAQGLNHRLRDFIRS